MDIPSGRKKTKGFSNRALTTSVQSPSKKHKSAFRSVSSELTESPGGSRKRKLNKPRRHDKLADDAPDADSIYSFDNYSPTTPILKVTLPTDQEDDEFWTGTAFSEPEPTVPTRPETSGKNFEETPAKSKKQKKQKSSSSGRQELTPGEDDIAETESATVVQDDTMAERMVTSSQSSMAAATADEEEQTGVKKKKKKKRRRSIGAEDLADEVCNVVTEQTLHGALVDPDMEIGTETDKENRVYGFESINAHGDNDDGPDEDSKPKKKRKKKKVSIKDAGRVDTAASRGVDDTPVLVPESMDMHGDDDDDIDGGDSDGPAVALNGKKKRKKKAKKRKGKVAPDDKSMAEDVITVIPESQLLSQSGGGGVKANDAADDVIVPPSNRGSPVRSSVGERSPGSACDTPQTPMKPPVAPAAGARATGLLSPKKSSKSPRKRKRQKLSTSLSSLEAEQPVTCCGEDVADSQGTTADDDEDNASADSDASEEHTRPVKRTYGRSGSVVAHGMRRVAPSTSKKKRSGNAAVQNSSGTLQSTVEKNPNAPSPPSGDSSAATMDNGKSTRTASAHTHTPCQSLNDSSLDESAVNSSGSDSGEVCTLSEEKAMGLCAAVKRRTTPVAQGAAGTPTSCRPNSKKGRRLRSTLQESLSDVKAVEPMKVKPLFDPHFGAGSRQWCTRTSASQEDFTAAGVPLRTGPWSAEEIQLLETNVSTFLSANSTLSVIDIVFGKDRNIRRGFYVAAAKGIRRPLNNTYTFIKRHYSPAMKTGRFSADEEKELLKLYSQHGPQWTKIGRAMNRAPEPLCMKYRALRDKLRVESECEPRRSWTYEEHELLETAVRSVTDVADGPVACPVAWDAVAAAMPGRTAVQCRRCWAITLSMGFRKGDWSDANRTHMVKVLCECKDVLDGEIPWPRLQQEHWPTVPIPVLQRCWYNIRRDVDSSPNDTFAATIARLIS